MGSKEKVLSLQCRLPRGFKSEDHARPWFCLVLIFFLEVASFPIGMSPRTMQDLGSVYYLALFSLEVASFLIGLSPRIMQDLGSVYYLALFSLEVASFLIGLNPRIMQDLGSV